MYRCRLSITSDSLSFTGHQKALCSFGYEKVCQCRLFHLGGVAAEGAIMADRKLACGMCGVLYAKYKLFPAGLVIVVNSHVMNSSTVLFLKKKILHVRIYQCTATKATTLKLAITTVLLHSLDKHVHVEIQC